jgi:hypothetical protein
MTDNIAPHLASNLSVMTDPLLINVIEYYLVVLGQTWLLSNRVYRPTVTIVMSKNHTRPQKFHDGETRMGQAHNRQ